MVCAHKFGETNTSNGQQRQCRRFQFIGRAGGRRRGRKELPSAPGVLESRSRAIHLGICIMLISIRGRITSRNVSLDAKAL